MHATRPVRRPVHAVLAAATAAVVVLGTAACDVRLETPAVTAPTPGPVEVLRAATVDDAGALAALAASVGAGPEVTAAGGPASPLGAAVAAVATAADAHAAALGGTYVSGLETPLATPTATATPGGTATAEPAVPAVTDPAALVAALVAGASAAGTGALDVADPGLARLLASVAVGRWGSARAVAAAAGLAAPEWPVPVSGAVPTVDGAAAPPSPSATADPQPEPTTAAVDAAAATALALAEDQAGYALEVVAAVLSGDARGAAVDAAAAHRSRGQTWAVVAGVAGATTDPRRAAYALPADAADEAGARALAASVETTLAQAYGAAIALSPDPASRPDLLAGLVAATVAQGTWGADPGPFPGAPDLAAAA